jgi:hypothetical protein
MNVDSCGRFLISADMNGDGAMTIADVGLWIQFFVLLPARLVSWAIYSVPGAADFFEMDCSTGSGGGGWFFSIVVWLIVLVALSQSNTSQKSK